MSKRDALAALGLAASVAGIAYLTLALESTRRFGRRPSRLGSATPPVTILKPLCGLEYELFENLRTFCEQAYPEFEIVFGVREPEDPAIAVVRALQARYPERRIELTVGAAAGAANPKIASLIRMLEHATGEIVVVSDADMRVGPEYLRQVIAAFDDDAVGAATCLYGAVPSGAPFSTLGAMFVNDQFIPSVLVASELEPLRYAFGATMAVRRTVLANIGGFAALGESLADDYELGKRVSESGSKVAFASYVVHTVVDATDLDGLWSTELRWSRTIRAVRRIGHALLFLTLPVPLAALAALVARTRAPALSVLGVALALRVGLHYTARETLRVRGAATPFLVPLRDALSFAVWVASFFGDDVRWRERRYEVDASGRLAGGE